MIWIVAIALGVAYVAALSLLLLFLAGAAKRNQRWDESNDALWQARLQSDGEKKSPAYPPAPAA